MCDPFCQGWRLGEKWVPQELGMGLGVVSRGQGVGNLESNDKEKASSSKLKEAQQFCCSLVSHAWRPGAPNAMNLFTHGPAHSRHSISVLE